MAMLDGTTDWYSEGGDTVELILNTPKKDVLGTPIERDGVWDWKVAFESWECPELAALLKPCPFCGGGFTFHQDVDYWHSGRIMKYQYYLHRDKYKKTGDYCPLVMIANSAVTLPAGDARPEDGYGGEIVEKWNRRANREATPWQ